MNKEVNSRSPLLQKLLVVIQFSLAIILISGTIVVYKQLGFIKDSKLGFDKSNLVHMRLRVNAQKYEALKNRLFQNPGVLGVAASNYLPTSVYSGTSSADWEGKAPNTLIQMQILSVDYDYLQTYKMEMQEGRFFSKEYPSDPSGSIVLNESAVKAMGIQSPIGKRITLGKTNYNIIGVIKNFHYKSIHRIIEPLIIKMFKPGSYGYLTVRIYPDNISEKINFLESIWKEYNPGYPFQYNFLDDTIYKLYKAEQQMGKIFIYFTLLAIFISCVGMIALSAFMAERKTKEIGIRKVFGASTSNITFLFLGEFAKWVLLANVIAWPVAYFFINKWLQNFAYRIDIKIWIFIFAGLSALVIAMITVGYQAVKTAVADPIKALKYE
jgi:ABC-type antimicrobial peptide transport system permease subunit